MEIPLSQGKVTVIDDVDAPIICPHTWHAVCHKSMLYEVWYAIARIDGHNVYMHRLIMGASTDLTVDHKDLDGLNNRRSNLRFATRSEQIGNTRPRVKRSSNASKYKGVFWHTGKGRNGKITGRWRAELELPGRKRIIRYAKTEEEALQLRVEMEKLYYGEFARPQII
jgi:hypothetical protein